MIESEVLTWNSKVANAILAQVQSISSGREQREHPAGSAVSHSCMQEGYTEVEEEPLYYRIPLSRILAWNRWRHITARLIVIVYKKKFWGLVGHYLQTVKGIPSGRLAILRANWSARGRELKQLSKQSP